MTTLAADDVAIFSNRPGLEGSVAATWDDRARRNNGHLLQSWQWGEFKQRHGWDVERVSVSHGGRVGLAQLLFKQRGPLSIAYLPRGPVLPEGDGEVARELVAAIDDACRQRRSLHLVIEPNEPLPFWGTFKDAGFVRGPQPFQPGRTVKVPLLPDDELLAQMHQKTRYSVRLAQRRGVVVERPENIAASAARFYDLLQDTSQRNEFGIHSLTYYADFLEHFAGQSLLLLARVDEELAAGLIAARFGEEAIYMYGGSSTRHRAHGASVLLQYEAMRWAREAGCRRYDLWGIPEQDPPTTAVDGERIAGTRGEDWRGLYRFKVGFGGDIVTYPQTLERRYHPVLSFFARRIYDNRA